MTVKEAVKLLAILKAAYPSMYPYNMSKDDAKITAIVWAEQFIDVPGEIVEIAVKQLIAKEEKITVAKVNKQLGSMYWEAKGKLDDDMRAKGFKLASLSEKDKAMYEFISSATKEYKHPNMPRVPSVAQIIGDGKMLMIEG
jgi:hypothetical protein